MPLMPAGAGLQDGFTIVEVILALVLLSFMVLGFQAATGEIIHHAAQSDRQAVAVQLAKDRLDLIRLSQDYEGMEKRFEAVETAPGGQKGLTRTTVVTRTFNEMQTGVLDYLTITVTVDGDGLRAPVARTIVIGAP